MDKHSKRYVSAAKLADLTKEYPLQEAVSLLSKFPKAKFDETVELALRLGVEQRHCPMDPARKCACSFSPRMPKPPLMQGQTMPASRK